MDRKRKRRKKKEQRKEDMEYIMEHLGHLRATICIIFSASDRRMQTHCE